MNIRNSWRRKSAKNHFRRFEESKKSKHFLTMEDTLKLVEQGSKLIREHEITAGTMGESCEGANLVEEVYQYIAAGTYPIECFQKKKRILRKKSKRFKVKDEELLYLDKSKRGERE